MCAVQYDVERTCRCCLRDVAKLIPLNEPHQDFNDSNPTTATATTATATTATATTTPLKTIGEVLMDFTDIQFSSEDGLPQRVCRKCIYTLRAAFLFRKMCEANDAKLREYFEQHLLIVKEDKFDVFFVDDDSIESTDVKGFDTNLYNDDHYQSLVDTTTAATTNAPAPTHSLMIRKKEEIENTVAETDRDDENREMDEMEGIDGEPKTYKCHICSFRFPRVFKNVIDYKQHMSCHRREKSFICDICKAAFTMKRNLVGHMESHKGDKYKHLCSYCGKAYTRLKALKSHVMYLHTMERPYVCDICPSAFHKLDNLRRHKLTHLAVKPFPCTLCDKSFVKADKLQRHVRVHTGERPYVCPHPNCNKTFNQTTNYKAHIRTHTGETPYRCRCGQLFSQSQQLLKHRRKFNHFETTDTTQGQQPQQQQLQ